MITGLILLALSVLALGLAVYADVQSRRGLWR